MQRFPMFTKRTGPQSNGTGRYARARAAGAALLAAALAACSPGHGTDCLKSTGAIVTQRRAVARGLATVRMYDNVDLRLVQDTATYAEVTAGAHLIDDIDFTRVGPTLQISNSSTCNWVRSYDTPRVVTLHVPRLLNLFLTGPGNISTVGEFRQDTVFYHLSGAGDYDMQPRARQVYVEQFGLGDVTLRGTTEELNFSLGGSGRMFAQGLTARRAYFTTGPRSLGDVHVRASDIVGCVIGGTGNVYYSGSPAALDIKRTGAGQAYAE
ncbi:GIN domain-containing protein [Hymenobacter caeli]|nr:DUF2807 domain-containing protein [Hymenobacter caeli]